MSADQSLLSAIPLHLLAGSFSVYAYTTAQVLLSKGADPNFKNEDGITPVHVAAAWGNYEMLKLLLLNGGDPRLLDNDHQTPLDLALEENHTECADLINWWLSTRPEVTSPYSPAKPKGPLTFKSHDSTKLVNLNNKFGNGPLSAGQKESPAPKTSVYEPKYFKSPLKSPAKNLATSKPYVTALNNKLPTHENTDPLNNGISPRRSPSKYAPILASPVEELERRFFNSKNEKEADRLNEGKFLKEINESLTFLKISKNSSPKRSPSPPSILNDSFLKTASLFSSHCASTEFETCLSQELTRVSRDLSDKCKIPGIRLDDNSQRRRSAVGHLLDASYRRYARDSASLDPEAFTKCQLLANQEIRARLLALGDDVGPVNDATRPFYVRRLAMHLSGDIWNMAEDTAKFSPELEKLLQGRLNLQDAEKDEQSMMRMFENPTKNWREGALKMSFCYLLIDPTKLAGLNSESCFRNFLNAIFYVGKGKKSRPFQHLIEAANFITCEDQHKLSAKLRRILTLWTSGEGVISLHVFQNIMPADAYTREAAIIDAIGLPNLTNVKRGDYYGLASDWTIFRRRRLGAHLLKKACAILQLEGAKPLKLPDILQQL